jgi:deferrochelatase/peroxidase EfeB
VAEEKRLAITRRGLLRAAGAAGAAGALAPASGAGASEARGQRVPFFGAHQPGIATPQQAALMLAAFDSRVGIAAELRALLIRWSAAAERMTRGLPAMGQRYYASQPPPDSGDTTGLAPGRLTVTFGFGPRIFTLPGLGGKRPSALRPLPRFAADRLDPRRSGGDILIQACAEDPAIAFHAVRMLHTLAYGAVRLRWTQLGFLPAAYRHDETPRNLMGMKDGTLNPRPGSPAFDSNVWVGSGDGPSWLQNGTYMVFRRIRMNLARWDSSTLGDQERTIGRHRQSGAPLGGRLEHDAPDLAARTASGAPVIPANAHIRLAHPSLNGGVEILRRGYSYDEGITEMAPLSDEAPHSRGMEFNAGLAFIAFMRSPDHFITLQSRLARSDRLNQYISHVGSGVFVVPPGARPGGFVGQTLLT